MLANALEVAVKSYISQRVPATQWLLTEAQSPPISTMLRRFVPTLKPARGVDTVELTGTGTLTNQSERSFLIRAKHLR